MGKILCESLELLGSLPVSFEQEEFLSFRKEPLFAVSCFSLLFVALHRLVIIDKLHCFVSRGLKPVPDEEVIELYGGTQHIPLYQMSDFYGKVL